MSTKQIIHKGWDTLPPLIHPDKANALPNPTERQKSEKITFESFQKASEVQEPKTYQRITFLFVIILYLLFNLKLETNLFILNI